MKKCKIKKMELGGFSMQKPTLEYSKGYGVGTMTGTGALGGAGTGAQIGTAIGGPVGTVIGTIGGGLIGGLSGLFGGLSKRKAGRDAELSQYQSEMRNYNLAKQSYADNLRNQDSMQLRDEKTSGYDIQSMYRFGGVLPKFLNGGKIPQYQAGGNTVNPPDSTKTKIDTIPLGLDLNNLSVGETDPIILNATVNEKKMNEVNNPNWTLVKDIGQNLINYGAGAGAAHYIANSIVPNYTGKIATGLSNIPENFGFIRKSKAQQMVNDALNKANTASQTNTNTATSTNTAVNPILQLEDGDRSVLGKQEGVKPGGNFKTDLNSRTFYNTGNTPEQLKGTDGSSNIVRVSSKNPKFRILPQSLGNSGKTFYQPPASEIKTIHLDPATGEIMKTKNALTPTGKLAEMKQTLRRFGIKGFGGLGSVLPAMSIGLDIANMAKQTPEDRKAQEYDIQSKRNQGWDYSNILTGISPEQVLMEDIRAKLEKKQQLEKDKLEKKRRSEDYKKAQMTPGTKEYEHLKRQSYK